MVYDHPKGKLPPQGVRPFMTVQLGRKTFDPHSANRYIQEIKRCGYSKEEIEKNL